MGDDPPRLSHPPSSLPRFPMAAFRCHWARAVWNSFIFSTSGSTPPEDILEAFHLARKSSMVFMVLSTRLSASSSTLEISEAEYFLSGLGSEDIVITAPKNYVYLPF